jgi:hypothetical protein
MAVCVATRPRSERPGRGNGAAMEEHARRGRRWYWLLVIPLIGTLIPPIYNTDHPEVAGIPFFYWYQLLWVPISVAITLLVYRQTDRARARAGGKR